MQICLIAEVRIVATENFYGELATQIGGPYVKVLSIMSNPNQDPHLFSSNADVAKGVADAQMLVYNGIGYDAWMNNLISANSKRKRVTICVADLVGKKMGDNPHIWYDPATMPAYAKELAVKLGELDPEHKEYFNQRLGEFNTSYTEITDQIERMKKSYAGSPICATEPVFNYMADALGLKMFGEGFQLSVMNDTEPSAKNIADFENRLKTRAVKVLIYNNQVSNPITERMQNLARQSKVAVVGISETQPVGKDYIQWITGELDQLETALREER